jgi:hypothetical protein
MGDVGETEGKASSDFKVVGGGLKLKQALLGKLLALTAGYGVGYRIYDEKMVGKAPDDHPYRGIGHTISVGAKVTFLKRFKALTGYNLGLRGVSGEPTLKSRTHKVRLGLNVKLIKGLRLFLDNSLMWVLLPEKTDKDRTRYQGIVGVRYMY